MLQTNVTSVYWAQTAQDRDEGLMQIGLFCSDSACLVYCVDNHEEREVCWFVSLLDL